MVSFLGLTFHWYGLLVGLALVIGWQLIEYRAQLDLALEKKLPLAELQQIMMVGLISGLVGARLWHVVTDWQLYQHDLLAVLHVWRGGLSIIGAVVTAMFGSALFCYWRYKKAGKTKLLLFLDLCIFGVPIAQAIGRLGNLVNQELYGLPTELPWKLFISPEARLTGYKQFEYFHPLFAYEAIATLLFGIGVWWHRRTFVIGDGKLAAIYVAYYSLVRFLLDFLRIDKTIIGSIGLGLNQVFLGFVFISVVTWLLKISRYVSK